MPHSVDDGWWEGELNGKIGLFPSLVVEVCRADGTPLTPEVSYERNEVSNVQRFFFWA